MRLARALALLPLCVAVHLVLFFSIFDIYFRSPIEPGIVPELVGLEEDGEDGSFAPLADSAGAAPAKRVVLIVADGLRADTCFRFLGRDERFRAVPSRGRPSATGRDARYQADALTWAGAKTSFLREVIENGGGRWGLSHTRVPTESRPGHVAMIAGFYEDVSAVTKGWQDNPVDFDHVFSQSRRAWLFGSPDITPMFAKRHAHVSEWSYSHEEEDFAAKDLTVLDTMVFNKVAALFRDAEANATLRDEMGQPKVLFFLHLLGLDSNGHAHRPHADEYYQNMALVDRGVRGVAELFAERFPDNRTAFIFTADHGMGNKGAHGDGDPANTRTPLVAWGAGVRAGGRAEAAALAADPRNGIETGFSRDEEVQQSRNWGLDHLDRSDVEQADLAPLMASLVGVPNPVHSVGRLPDLWIEPSRYSAQALVRNARQLLAQVRHKARARASRQALFAPFPQEAEAERLAAEAQALLHLPGDGEIDLGGVKRLAEASMALALRGLHYYQVYDRPYLMAVVVAGYIGWVLVLVAEVSFPPRAAIQAERWTPAALAALALAAALIGVHLLESSPWSYNAYVAVAAAAWVSVLRRPLVLGQWARLLRTRPRDAAALAVVVLGTQVLVLSYSHRVLYVPLFLALAAWPVMEPALAGPTTLLPPRRQAGGSSNKAPTVIASSQIKALWAANCALLGAFTLAPLDMNDSPTALILGALALLAALWYFLFSSDENRSASMPSKHKMAQLAMLVAAAAATVHTDLSLGAKRGLPRVNQAVTWLAFFASPVLATWSAPTPYKRFLSVFASLATPMCLLSINYELLFYTVLGGALLQWLEIERAILYYERKRAAMDKEEAALDGAVNMGDIRTAFVFLLMVHIAFFGTGNIASMSSFQLSATYRFVTVFRPFLMGALCIATKLIPYLLVTSMSLVLAAERRAFGSSTVSPLRQFLVVIALYDLLAVSLFFFVRDSGSWLDIGNSISQFGLANAQCIFLPILFSAASLFLRDVPLHLPLEIKE